MATSKKGVELGFVEEAEPCYFKSHYFPSKVGGKPAWLALENLPNGDQLTCRTCKKPSVFLLQVYAPFTEKESCFHRTVFVFICKNPDCCKKNDSSNLLVFRSQLSKKVTFSFIHLFHTYQPLFISSLHDWFQVSKPLTI